eukprot:Opistho-2@27686
MPCVLCSVLCLWLLLDPAPDEITLHLAGRDDRRRVCGIGRAEVEVMGALGNVYGHNAVADRLKNAPSAPWVQHAVAEDNVRRRREIAAPKVRRRPIRTRGDSPPLAAIGCERGDIPVTLGEHVADAVGGHWHDHLGARLVVPSERPQVLRRLAHHIVARGGPGVVVVDANRGCEWSKEIGRRQGNRSNNAIAGCLHGPSGHRLKETCWIGIVGHRKIRQTALNPRHERSDVFIGLYRGAEAERGRSLRTAFGRGKHCLQLVKCGANGLGAALVGGGEVVCGNGVEYLRGSDARELHNGRRGSNGAVGNIRIVHAEP